MANDITFAEGPAGSGKTHIAVGMAVSMLRDNQVQRIILTRPAIESGSSLGYLPGTLEEKMNPYLRPLYDELEKFMEGKLIKAWMEHNTLEICPLSYMRGRTLDNAFIILDEAQNALPRELKMALTRIGINSKMVITGDTAQSDLNPQDQGGMERCMDRLEDINGVAVAELTEADIVRHGLIAQIEARL
jgi:phosphate starvation-inducible PhoH-like protein